MQAFTYSPEGLGLTKRFEGLRLSAYQDSGGIWTVGYGHTGSDVQPERRVTELEAEALLRVDLRDAISCVNRAVRIFIQQNHFDALVDFCFNAGRGSFLRSNLLTQLNANNLEGTASQFGTWIHVNGNVMPGLVRRRAAEAAMFRGQYRATALRSTRYLLSVTASPHAAERRGRPSQAALLKCVVLS